MKGSLILIAGVSGAGKTTLMRAAAKRVDGLQMLQTTTTRPRREGEVDGQEYVFVSDEAYEKLRAASVNWDHLEYHGYKYGADAVGIRRLLEQGTSLICTITPDPEEIQMLERAYDVTAKTIWLDVPRELAAMRIASDTHRASRIETEPDHHHFTHVFTPTGDLDQDELAFSQFVNQLLG